MIVVDDSIAAFLEADSVSDGKVLVADLEMALVEADFGLVVVTVVVAEVATVFVVVIVFVVVVATNPVPFVEVVSLG